MSARAIVQGMLPRSAREKTPPSRPRGADRDSPAHRLYVHVAWTTLGCLPLIAASSRGVSESHLLALCRWLGTEPVETCVLPDRVHLLLRFRPGQSLSDLIRRIQEGSEGLLDRAGHPVRWSRRYAAVSVSPGEVRTVRRRIARRAEAASWPAVEGAPESAGRPAAARVPIREPSRRSRSG